MPVDDPFRLGNGRDENTRPRDRLAVGALDDAGGPGAADQLNVDGLRPPAGLKQAGTPTDVARRLN